MAEAEAGSDAATAAAMEPEAAAAVEAEAAEAEATAAVEPTEIALEALAPPDGAEHPAALTASPMEDGGIEFRARLASGEAQLAVSAAEATAALALGDDTETAGAF